MHMFSSFNIHEMLMSTNGSIISRCMHGFYHNNQPSIMHTTCTLTKARGRHKLVFTSWSKRSNMMGLRIFFINTLVVQLWVDPYVWPLYGRVSKVATVFARSTDKAAAVLINSYFRLGFRLGFYCIV